MYAIYAYIDPPNHPNVGIYGSPMQRLGLESLELLQQNIYRSATQNYRWIKIRTLSLMGAPKARILGYQISLII